ncbi:MAG TPA: nucleoside hydrolase [Ignavibacteriaceae bacterium]
MSVKILLDTDIGSDIDDAVCLAWLLANPDCELLGITTVTGEPVKRAMIASALCKIAGKNIPIHPGSANPILIPQLQIKAKQAKALNSYPHRKEFPSGEAVEFLRKTIRKYPGEVTLLTIAPLTNIGLLFSADSEIPPLLKGVVSMCGNFLREYSWLPETEWNAMGDYHATSIVYNAGIKMHKSIGLDVTSRVTMKPEEFKKRFSSHKLLRPVLEFSKEFFKEWDVVTFHDPLAAVSIFDKAVCTFERGNVEIETSEKNKQGLTRWYPGKKGKQMVAVNVDPGRFFERYFSVFK